MKQYIGTKVVSAEPAYKAIDPEGNVVIITGTDNAELTSEGTLERGYRVVYKDGYESWSPEDVFEEAYRETTGLSFGLAIEAAKKGCKIARAGWNGKNQHIELAMNISYTPMCGAVVNAQHDAIGNKAFAFCGTSGVQMGWLASQADMLADDWAIVEGPAAEN